MALFLERFTPPAKILLAVSLCELVSPTNQYIYDNGAITIDSYETSINQKWGES